MSEEIHNRLYSLLEKAFLRNEERLKQEKLLKAERHKQKVNNRYIKTHKEELLKLLISYKQDANLFLEKQKQILRYYSKLSLHKTQDVCIFRVEELGLIVVAKKVFLKGRLTARKYYYLDNKSSFYCITIKPDCMIVAKRYYFTNLIDDPFSYVYKTALKFDVDDNKNDYTSTKLDMYNQTKDIVTTIEDVLLNLNPTYLY